MVDPTLIRTQNQCRYHLLKVTFFCRRYYSGKMPYSLPWQCCHHYGHLALCAPQEKLPATLHKICHYIQNISLSSCFLYLVRRLRSVALSSLLNNFIIFSTVYTRSNYSLPTPLMCWVMLNHMLAPALVPASVCTFCITMASAANNHVLPVTPIDAGNRDTSTVLLQFVLTFNLSISFWCYFINLAKFREL
jgi:hypothetical protein